MKHIAITKTEINGVETNSVLLRDLHTMLGLKTEFANWLKDQKEILETYEDGRDFIRTAIDKHGETLIVKSGLNLRGKQSEYIISLDMAKHLCMLSRTDEGKKARQYFINIEKQYQKDSNLQLDIQMQRLDVLTDFAKASRENFNIHDQRLTALEENRRLEAFQERMLMDEKNRKVYEIAGDDKQFANKLHRKVWQLFKKQFSLPRYSELQSGKFDAGIDYLRNLTLADMVA